MPTSFSIPFFRTKFQTERNKYKYIEAVPQQKKQHSITVGAVAVAVAAAAAAAVAAAAVAAGVQCSSRKATTAAEGSNTWFVLWR